MNALRDIIARHKAGAAVGMYSVCSAHPLVIEATLRLAKDTDSVALIEATSNQVNQDGGYTGMRPAVFRERVLLLADGVALPRERVLLGGDHLGPNCWQADNARVAMAKAGVMVAEYVAAGFRKIHLDCSMSCADDPPVLGDERIAERAAILCTAAEAAWQQTGGELPQYIVGTEVPVPGGAHEDLQVLVPTAPAAVRATIDAHRAAFGRQHLHEAWSRVVGLVAQPGVEFDHQRVIDYQPAAAQQLSACIDAYPGMVFEAHSTDYQLPDALRALVQDHFAILKVGPGATFVLREALWALDQIETEWLGTARSSRLRETTLAAMREDPIHWRKYHEADDPRLDLQLQYSLSDRIRYYWPVEKVQAAVTRLFTSLDADPPPLALVSQYLPASGQAIREGRITARAREMVIHHVTTLLASYAAACGLNVKQRHAHS